MPDTNLRNCSSIVLNISFISFSLLWCSHSLYAHSVLCLCPVVLDIFCSVFPCYLFSFLFSFRDFYGDIHRLRESSSAVATPRGGILFVTVVLSLAFPSGSFLGGHLSAHIAHLGCRLLSPWGPLMLFGVNLTSWPDHLSIFAMCGSDPASLSLQIVFFAFFCAFTKASGSLKAVPQVEGVAGRRPER